MLEPDRDQPRLYARGEVPSVADPFHRDLFNTYRSYSFPSSSRSIRTVHCDARGDLFETVRSHGGTGQAFVSTTVPGATRGDHYHLQKIERFFVVQGQRRDRVASPLSTTRSSASGSMEAPRASSTCPRCGCTTSRTSAIEDLVTMFWADQLLDPTQPRSVPRTRGDRPMKVMTIVGTRPEIIRLRG